MDASGLARRLIICVEMGPATRDGQLANWSVCCAGQCPVHVSILSCLQGRRITKCLSRWLRRTRERDDLFLFGSAASGSLCLTTEWPLSPNTDDERKEREASSSQLIKMTRVLSSLKYHAIWPTGQSAVSGHLYRRLTMSSKVQLASKQIATLRHVEIVEAGRSY